MTSTVLWINAILSADNFVDTSPDACIALLMFGESGRATKPLRCCGGCTIAHIKLTNRQGYDVTLAWIIKSSVKGGAYRQIESEFGYFVTISKWRPERSHVFEPEMSLTRG
jgi:hypothetical protein